MVLRIVGSSNFKLSATEQSASITFCILLYKSLSETLCGNEAKKKTQIYERCKRFRDGRSNVNDDSRCGLTTRALTKVPKNGLQECLKTLYEYWKKCVAVQENVMQIDVRLRISV